MPPKFGLQSTVDGWIMIRCGRSQALAGLAPVDLWPDSWRGMLDHKREFCLCNRADSWRGV